MEGSRSTLQSEIHRWREREHSTLVDLEEVKVEEKALLRELQKVEEQVAYYDSLERGMKRELEPPQLKQLLRSLSRR